MLFILGSSVVVRAVEATAEASKPALESAALKKEAVEAAKEAAAAYPTDALGFALLGSASYNLGQSTEAAAQLKRCLELNPDLAEPYEILARIAYEKGELEESVRLCQENLKRGPADREVLNRLGRAQMDLGRPEEAAATLQRVAATGGATAEGAYLLGQAWLQAGEPAKAREAFRRAIELVPDHTQAYFGLFTASLRLGDTAEAERYRDRFQQLEATDRRALTDRSTQGETLTGLPFVRQTVARTLFGAAQLHRVHGQADKALALQRRAALLDAENPMYRGALESYFLQKKAPEEGVAFFRQMVSEQPSNTLNHLFLGRLQFRQGDFEGAESSYRKMQELSPDRADGYRAVAELYLRADRKTTEAPAQAQKAVEREPNASNYHLLALSYIRNDNRAGAVEAARQAIARGGGDPRYQQLLKQAEQLP